MENTCKVIPFPGTRTTNADQPSSPYHLAANPEVVALLREALPPGVLELIEAFRGIPKDRRAALIAVAASWKQDHEGRARALNDLRSALTPAERFHLDKPRLKEEVVSAVVSAFEEGEGL